MRKPKLNAIKKLAEDLAIKESISQDLSEEEQRKQFELRRLARIIVQSYLREQGMIDDDE